MKDGQTIGQWLKWDFEVNRDLKIEDKNGHRIYLELSNGFWIRREYDSKGNYVYYEDSTGVIMDKRIPEIPEIIEHNGHKYQLIR